MLEMAEFIQQNFSWTSCRILCANWFDFKFNGHDVCRFASQLINVRYINSPSSRTIKFMMDESSLKSCSSSIFPALFCLFITLFKVLVAVWMHSVFICVLRIQTTFVQSGSLNDAGSPIKSNSVYVYLRILSPVYIYVSVINQLTFNRMIF